MILRVVLKWINVQVWYSNEFLRLFEYFFDRLQLLLDKPPFCQIKLFAVEEPIITDAALDSYDALADAEVGLVDLFSQHLSLCSCDLRRLCLLDLSRLLLFEENRSCRVSS